MIKPFSRLTIAALALALAAPAVHAQARKKPAPPAATKAPAAAAPAPAGSGGIGAGDTELNFFGSLSDSDFGGTTILLGFGLGKFVSDNLETKIVQSMTVIDADALSLFNYSPYVSMEYQIRPNPAAPFVAYAGGGLGLGLSTIDAGGSDFFTYSLYVTPVGGFKYFLNERTSLTYSLSYQFPLVEQICGDTDCFDSETTTLQNTLGFSIYY